MADKQEEIRKFLENMPDTFSILEEGIDEQTQKEYLDYSHSFFPSVVRHERFYNTGF